MKVLQLLLGIIVVSSMIVLWWKLVLMATMEVIRIPSKMKIFRLLMVKSTITWWKCVRLSAKGGELQGKKFDVANISQI
eukprot:9837867-Ditylum_brightwellii.AAC.1